MQIGVGFGARIAALLVLAMAPTMAGSQEIPGVGSAQLASAKVAFASAQLVVAGRTVPDAVLVSRIKAFMAADPTNSVQDGSFNFTAAIAATKKVYANPSFAIEPISNAFIDVYGRGAYPDEASAWTAKVVAQQAWFASIVTAERKRMNADSFARRQMIERAYMTAFGRVDSEADRAYWLPRNDNYVEIVESARNYIYARPAEVEVMVRRALRNRYVIVTEANVAEWRAKAIQGHWAYAHLRAQLDAR